MSQILLYIGAFLLIMGFWVFVSAFDRTGGERVYRVRVGIGSMIAGLGNVLTYRYQGFPLLLVVIGAFIALTAVRHRRSS